ncbi:MAG TPA: FG-GAP-like repeat-containing protein [Pyrinomonadaceae bacterium]|nr:FG-GAP-like repeat-containing protein [Pyrinomonadaceae bacterium]
MKYSVKLISIIVIFVFALAVFLFSGQTAERASAIGSGPPAGFSGAPDEFSCNVCHGGATGMGTFVIKPPPYYLPGQTYPVEVRHTTTDMTRLRWGFQMTSIVGSVGAGTFSSPNANAQTVSESGRSYAHHTTAGTFTNQTGGAVWNVNWTAPSTNAGTVMMWGTGNQANSDMTSDGDLIITSSARVPQYKAVFDMDGDQKTDVSIFRPNGASSEWWWLRSSNGGNSAVVFGANTDTIVPADYTGDGKTDVAFWRPSTGNWFILRSEDLTFYAFPFGANGDVPVPGDYDADGKADAAVFRESATTWFINKSSGGTDIVPFGAIGDKPVNADFDGDGKDDVAILRPNAPGGAQWWIRRSSTGVTFAAIFGVPNDRPVIGDYTGDGKADLAFFRPSNSNWYVLRSEDFSFFAFPFGANGDIAVPGDYDGDGKFDAGVFRPSNSTWFVQRSTAGTLIQQFGITNDVPLPAAYVR